MSLVLIFTSFVFFRRWHWLMQCFRQQHRRVWRGCACGGAAREQQPDRPRVSVVPSVVFEGVRVLSARDSLLNLFFFLFAGALYICSSSSGALIDSCWQNNCLRRQTLGPFFAYTAAVCGFLPYPAHVSLELMLTTLNYPRR